MALVYKMAVWSSPELRHSPNISSDYLVIMDDLDMMEVDIERESTSSTPPLLNNSSDSSGDDFDLLPLYVCTPKKTKVDRVEDTTPPMRRSNDSTSNLQVPSSSTSPFTISPLKLQPTIIVNDEKENKASNKLLLKTVNCVRKTRERKIRDDRINEIERSGGIMAMSIKADATTKQVNKDIESPGIDPALVMKELNNNVVNLPPIPGVPFFVDPPSFHKGFSGISVATGNPLIDRVIGEHANVSGIYQLVLALNGKELPRSVLLWLIENACLSRDMVIRTTSLFALSQISPICSSVSSTIELKDFHLILSRLGAKPLIDDNQLSTQCVQQSPADTTDTTPVNTELLRSSVLNFSKAVLIIMEYFNRDHSTDHSLIQGLSMTLLRISLDPVICSDFVSDQVSACLHTVITSADDQAWEAIQSEIMSFCKHVVCNHYNQYCVVTLLMSAYPRVSSLQCDLIRLFLTALCRDSTREGQELQDGGHMHDMTLAKNVLQCFINKNDIAFDELHSIMKMLAILLKSPKMQWGAVQSFKKKDLIDMLSKLSGGIKDNMPGVVIERGPVKDFIISLKLELQSSKCGEKVQKSMFDYAIEDDDS